MTGELLDRERELAEIDRLIKVAGEDSGGLVVVEGAAGIGKTRLLEEAARVAAAAGIGVLRARGSEFEAGIGFGVARQLFEPMLHAAPAGERDRLLGGVARVGARALGVADGERPADRFAAIHGIYWLCANRAEEGPLAVVVDDAQWADDPSLAWLGYLGRRVDDLPVVLVLGLRSGDPGGERSELAQLVGGGGARRMVLGPLSGVAVGEIVRGQLDQGATESFCAAVGELSGGNPLFVRELLAGARQEGLAADDESVAALERIAPAAVGSSVLARLGRLDSELVALARAVAVLGSGAEVMLAARLAELDPAVAELAADRLAAAQILARSRPLEFFHPLIGAAVLEDIAPGARRVAHRRAAALLEREEGDRALARIAAHLLACGPAADPWVVRQLAEAAREALEQGAPEIAADYARRALAEPPAEPDRAALLLSLGTAEWRAGQPDAIEHLEQAIGAAGDDHQALLRATGRLARAYYVTDHAERAVEVLERSIAAVSDIDPGWALRFEAAAAMIGMLNERTAPAAVRRAEGLRARLSTLAEPPVDLLVMLSYQAVRANRAVEAQELTDRALACMGYPPTPGISTTPIVLLGVLEGYDALDRLCRDMLEAARHRGAMQELAQISAHLAWASYQRGALADAEADARWALEHGEGVNQWNAIAELVKVLIERDELQAAQDVVDRSADPRGSRSIEVARFLLARGRLHAEQGRLEEALDDFRECGQRCTGMEFVLHGAPWRGEAALVSSALGNAAEARRLAHEQLELARAFGRPWPLGISQRACGLVETGETGLELLGDAVKTLERSQSPLELARALSDYGAALRRAGQRVQARAELERALDLAHGCGARRVANQARAELIAAGAKPRRDAITGRDALTASELRVARLAAGGLANREIAQALFITTKTAKGHLSHVYHKLGITGRGQLPDALSGPVEKPTEAPSVIEAIW